VKTVDSHFSCLFGARILYDLQSHCHLVHCVRVSFAVVGMMSLRTSAAHSVRMLLCLPILLAAAVSS
jgi:hypothetical protein